VGLPPLFQCHLVQKPGMMVQRGDNPWLIDNDGFGRQIDSLS